MRTDLTLDRFLDGCIAAEQPKHGFRAGHDTVLLAAAIPPGRKILELGSGTGIASLCYAWRARDAVVNGYEIDPDLVEIANANAARNGMGERVNFTAGDICTLADLGEEFEHAFFNPPFHPAVGTESPGAARNSAKRDPGSMIADWTETALRAVRPQGTVTAILRFDRVPEMLAAGKGKSAAVFPFYPRRGAEPKRAIVRITAGKHGPARNCSGLILHRADGGNTQEAEAILRRGASLFMD